jgi:hypothetical protein
VPVDKIEELVRLLEHPRALSFPLRNPIRKILCDRCREEAREMRRLAEERGSISRRT